MTTSTHAEAAVPLLSHVLDEIGAEIVTGVIKTDQRFTLQDISVRFGISRTVAREAMRALEQMGLVMSSRRVGLTVLPMTEWNVFDQQVINWRLAGEKSRGPQLHSLNQVRLAIEPIAARLAASTASEEQRGEILDLALRLHELEVSPSHRVGEELAIDLRFHASILYASGNEMFAALAPSLLAMLKGKSVYGSRKRDPMSGTVDLHIELAEAIRDGEAAQAERLAREILDETSSTSI
ncbi:FCD domain protein [Corynebacterium sp. CMW7794]|uniref:FadR family transcriptional regulator n=1 Tax=Corynebacterium phoceense TaxID=1686286 RepID=A0A540R8E3_9CORY|nr:MULTISPECIES: FCD domain-containing protein [Corynebacterium]KXB53357.1 FCD domain protein [Corynebacterium sp. DNF00584]KXI17342.1 FCD domain protein [Corynebacterium sp. CMW7794]MBF9011878.1 FadR family transcriptional regulator [Corynebacterium phoceense]OFL77811.1 transcriptional regulator [Corynebacterium sp. HMSC077B05]OFN40541.1 transcriptional regulator [Corynebacterium sp. HMSC072G08]